ncbi:MAG: biotin--[acetyl-CoA-carboxylase] ligase [Candidatus Sericytochromatia bacterium]|nr:biotin--[acetyl-CoA-carboxylase] ligase [Candidatus Sericytochromatia bacterium]
MTPDQHRYFLEDVDSTSEEIRRRLRAGHPEDARLLVWTTRQTAGHGQRGRTWESPPGNLAASWWLPALPRHGWITPWAGLAVLEASSCLGLHLRDIGLKWVNDLVHVAETGQARKWGGILAEAPTSSGILLGIGLNLVPAALPEATWVGAFSPITPAPEDWIDALDRALGAPASPSAIRSAYVRACRSLGREALWQGADGTSERGVVSGLSEDGGVILVTPDGRRLTLRSGRLRGPTGRYM